MQEVHIVGVITEQVAQGMMQLELQDKADVKKNPSIQEIQPAAVQVLQFAVQATHVVPDR